MTRRYVAMLEAVLRHRKFALVCSLVVLAVALASLAFIGTEFMPRLDEGSILLETRKLPGISLTDSVEISRRIEKTLRTFPEIADVTIKIGRPDFATEAMGINEGDTYLALRPTREWTRFHSKGELIDALDKELSKIPGLNYDFTQPMAMRVDETVSGVKADLAIKIFGDDFATLNNLARAGCACRWVGPGCRRSADRTDLRSRRADRSCPARSIGSLRPQRQGCAAGGRGGRVRSQHIGDHRGAKTLLPWR